ncbi:alpha/beta fold hydrolase [Pseudanabaena sp. PCC 6802]|uniref:alpha/beta fold hydrolase n=1 Tax=Pseudanabaena sp. PCC 6802 TaxID=118173 RepID=UPI00034C3C6C|nr:alpha/beta hydrolase [Pseudanabaena sp. PCC 6802]
MHKQKIALREYTAAYLEQGEGQPIVFLHGFLGEASAWEPVVQQLSGQFHCIALDLLGFGESSKPKLKYTIWHQVEFLREFIAAMQLKEFYLAGHSYGGWTASAYAIAGSDTDDDASNMAANSYLKSMFLIAPAGIRDDSFVGRYNHLKPLLWETKLVDVALALIAPIATLIGKRKQFQTVKYARRELVDQPVAKTFLFDRLRPEDAIDTVEKDIHRINIPTLVIAGELDDTIPLWHCQTYADKIPRARLEILAGADHALISTHAEAIAQAIATTNRSTL